MSDLISREKAIRATIGMTSETGIDEAPLEYAEDNLRRIPSADIMECARAIKEYCEHFPECEGCRFYKGYPFGCAFGMCPQEWKLPEVEAKPNESLIKDCCEAQGHLWADNNIFEDVEENQ